MAIASTERVPRNTEEEVNRRIRTEIERSVRWHAAGSSGPLDCRSRVCVAVVASDGPRAPSFAEALTR